MAYPILQEKRQGKYDKLCVIEVIRRYKRIVEERSGQKHYLTEILLQWELTQQILAHLHIMPMLYLMLILKQFQHPVFLMGIIVRET
ncbi:hypothetical protein QMX21_004842 [Escherichia coli]|nr:hypothetical protein [Escherichia coli]EJS1783039.1 hypothetical protein [Escherichia coli]ELW2073802.1 hypothetical protein [Escherichia coli]HDP8228026.1 hypothetical protein [Escherichia coli]